MSSQYGQFCPVAVASEIFAERWTPIVLRELFLGSTRFNDIHRGVPRMSRALLARRLRELERVGVVKHEAEGDYRLTAAGEEFGEVLIRLGEWGQRWTSRVDRDHLDSVLLMWDLRRRIAMDRLPEERVTVRFDYRGVPARQRRTFWLVLQRNDVDVCDKDPGFEPQLFIDAELSAFTRVWLGDLTFAQAQLTGAIRLSGERRWARAFPSWLLLSSMAEVSRQGSINQKRAA
jgi:DNA-binding HxlR family transcriptional regulator/putative sterol carrier protein